MTNTTISEVKERLDRGESLHIIDVREANEYAEDNIGATLLPLSTIRNFDSEAIEDFKDQELIIHCRSGKRSIEACLLLEQMGFTNVVNLEGGIMEWRQQLGETNYR